MDDLLEFLEVIRDQIHLVAIVPDGPARARYFGTDKDAAAAWAKDENAAGKNLYYTKNRVRPGLNKKPAKPDMVGFRFAYVDIDPPKDGGMLDGDAVCDRLEQSPVPPSSIIWSGNGVQALWRLKEGATIEQVEQASVSERAPRILSGPRRDCGI